MDMPKKKNQKIQKYEIPYTLFEKTYFTVWITILNLLSPENSDKPWTLV